jgi:hypothetical protein
VKDHYFLAVLGFELMKNYFEWCMYVMHMCIFIYIFFFTLSFGKFCLSGVCGFYSLGITDTKV